MQHLGKVIKSQFKTRGATKIHDMKVNPDTGKSQKACLITTAIERVYLVSNKLMELQVQSTWHPINQTIFAIFCNFHQRGEILDNRESNVCMLRRPTGLVLSKKFEVIEI